MAKWHTAVPKGQLVSAAMYQLSGSGITLLNTNKIPSVIRQGVFFLSISPGYFKQYAELSEHSGRTFNLCIPALP